MIEALPVSIVIRREGVRPIHGISLSTDHNTYGSMGPGILLVVEDISHAMVHLHLFETKELRVPGASCVLEAWVGRVFAHKPIRADMAPPKQMVIIVMWILGFREHCRFGAAEHIYGHRKHAVWCLRQPQHSGDTPSSAVWL